MAGRSKHLLSVALVVLIFIGSILTARSQPLGNPVKTNADLMALVLTVVLFMSLTLVPRRRRAPLESIDFMLAVALVGMSLAVVVWPTTRMAWNVPLLVGLAYRLGRWRGREESNVELSDSPREIWSRHA